MKHQSTMKKLLAALNEQWALLRYIQGELESALLFEVECERITRIFVQRNPDKLTRIAAAYHCG